MLRADNRLAGKRILFVFCALELGGAERQGLYLAQHLQRLGCDVRVWSNHSTRGLVADLCDQMGIPWAVRRFHWPCRKSSLVRDCWRLLMALRKERPDVVLSYTTWPCVGMGIVCPWSPAKVFVWGQRNCNNLRGDSVERFAYRRATAIICNAKHEVDYLHRTLGKPSAPISVVANGCDIAPPKRARAEWRADLAIDDAVPVVTMVANFRPQKDHATLLHAWRRVLLAVPNGSQPRLLVAGLPQETYESARELASELKLMDTVSFLGQVQDVSGLLQTSDIGVLTSRHEGLPNAIIEYMASGLPVVATDVPGNREALGEDLRQPFCAPGDAEAIASQIATLLTNPQLRRDAGIRNRLRAQAEFSVDAMCEKTVDILCELLSQHTVPMAS